MPFSGQSDSAYRRENLQRTANDTVALQTARPLRRFYGQHNGALAFDRQLGPCRAEKNSAHVAQVLRESLGQKAKGKRRHRCAQREVQRNGRIDCEAVTVLDGQQTDGYDRRACQQHKE